MPDNKKYYFDFSNKNTHRISNYGKIWSVFTFFLGLIALIFVITLSTESFSEFINPLVSNLTTLKPLTSERDSGYEIFGFAPYWTINKMNSVDFNLLTTLAYFGVPIKKEGGLDKSDYGYTVFNSDKATALFQKAHQHKTRVVLTITNMENDSIEQFLESDSALELTIKDTINIVKERGIDGVNIDIEYVGTPRSYYRKQFSKFVKEMTDKMHQEIPHSKVTVSVYASSAKERKLYDIAEIGNTADGIFMMAYDFAVKGSSRVMPTAPLYGYKEGKYSYDVSTAVEDFTRLMPADKLILGVPYYGYNYLVYGEPKVKAETRPSWSWRGKPLTQTYEIALESLKPERQGWDELGQVGWSGYYVPDTDTWRMIFLDDPRSLGIKYDFAKSKNLAGVGMWALGFDHGREELWTVLREKFGSKNLADNRLKLAEIN